LDSHLEESIATRMLDQRALDDRVLVEVCQCDPEMAAQLARIQPGRSLTQSIQRIPLLGPLAVRMRRAFTRGQGSER
jgi:hypothetical protein